MPWTSSWSRRPWTGRRATPAASGSLPGSNDGPAVAPMPLAQVSACTKGAAQQELAVGAVEDIEEAVAIRLQQQLPRAAAVRRIHQHGRFGGIPIVQIVRRELVVPLQLAGRGIERQHGIGIQIVALALVAVEIRTGIADGPEQRVGFGIVGAGEPGRRAAVLDGAAHPGRQRPDRRGRARSRSARRARRWRRCRRPRIRGCLRRRPRCRKSPGR